ncbi:methyl-accepting chemotaxis protein [Salipiger abyssi]|uniref:Methyl-accepting chemotaxis protein n=1 Tax=Salipiger abyssi TaxID=1250539 RepID=A0A1P8UYJ5_9RHOB|nr:methyl-accepting chemotaxis protein [Salipiger abyssi]APZ54472.1 methyl-accepting chemotaxis protein [Salipiger abyssi]
MQLAAFGARLRSLFHSVFVRAALLLAVTTIAVASVMAWQSWHLTMRIARDGVVSMAHKTVESQAGAMVQPLRFKDEGKLSEQLSLALQSGGADALGGAVVQADGTVLADAGVAAGDRAALAALAARAVAEASVQSAQDGLWVAAPILVPGRADPAGAVAMIWTDQAVLASAAGDKREIQMTALAVFVVMMALTVFLLRRIIARPLGGLDAAMARVARGDYDSAVDQCERSDEFGEIARHLSDLAATLAQGRAAEEARMEAHAAQDRVVRHLTEALDRLADGGLAEGIQERFPSEYEALRENFNRAVDSLRDAINEVRVSAQNIHSNAEEIASGSDDLSHRTETQAATLEQTAAALEQLLGSVRDAARTTKEVEENVRGAARMADENGEIMRSAVSAMAGIAQSSDQIGQIIGVIDDIAFQTNLLALNAGVEAARAGESGRGFAVVASEVRALAQRSSDAAQQIKTLISGSADQVKDGVQLVERAGEALGDVVHQVGQISDLVSGIASVSTDQAQGLNEINVGVGNLDRVTQQNAAMVEQSTAAAHMLRSDAGALSELVARFDIGQPAGGQGGPAPRAAPGRAA